MPRMEMICLANSRKLSARCVAGLRTDGRGWVRPMVDSPTGALRPWHYLLPDRSPAQVLDVLRIDLVAPRPRPHQPENWLIRERRWELVARPAPDRLAPLLAARLAPGPDLLGDDRDSVAYAELARQPAGASLALVAPTGLQWHLKEGRPGEVRARADFLLGGARYDLAITDPIWEERLSRLPRGYHPPAAAGLKPEDRVLFTISLGDPFPENSATARCYKLVATVLVLPSSWRGRFEIEEGTESTKGHEGARRG